MSIAIRVENLTKIYKLYDTPSHRLKEALHPLRKIYHHKFYALNDVNFNVKKGETVGIIGRNGSGKSTLLQILTGVLTPSYGQFETKGKILALLELGAGFNPELTGIENIYFNGTLLGIAKKKIDAKLDAILEFADIGEFIYQPVKTYSSGMYVRLAFAVIANIDASILIIDEALSVGDAYFVQKCMRFLRKFIEKGTLVFVSHDTGAILNLCDRAIWLSDGLVLRDGHPKDVTEAYLADFYEAKQGANVTPLEQEQAVDIPVELRDMRLDFINSTILRNDIELFAFKKDGLSFGKGGATINSVYLLDNSGKALSWVVGGEEVCLVIKCHINEFISNPIIGFTVKDRLGQEIFVDNTFLAYAGRPIPVVPGQILQAEFFFRMPVLPVGDYSISVAIAEGTQLEHIQQQWINDALLFKVHTSSVCLGLVGVPMKEIRMSVK